MHLLFPIIALCLFVATVTHGARARSLSVVSIIRQTFPDDARRAVCIATAESHLWPGAQNGTNTGLFQVDQATWDPARNYRARPIVGNISWSRMHEAAYNAMVARRIYLYVRRTRSDHNGWNPWSTRGLCGA